jgi:hypothetical protein
MSEYYDRQGNPITLMEWARRLEGKSTAAVVADKRVAEDVLPNGYWVSTVWLGLNHAFGDGPPLIFESMVFPCSADGKVTDWLELDSDRYSTEAEALTGHAALVAKWTQETPQSVAAVDPHATDTGKPPTRD